jgi:Tol biopolymer transport system component
MGSALSAALFASACMVVAVASGCSLLDDEPDDGEIVFVRETAQGEAIYLMSDDGRDVRRLVEGTSPRWSPDGRRLAYIVDDDGKTRYTGTSVWVMNADNGDRRRVVSAEAVWALAWAPDGVRLAYSDPARLGIFVVDTETGQTELVSIELPVVDGLDWSPDGRELLVSGGNVRALDVRSGAERYVAPPRLSTDDGRWSPDGDRLAFAHVAPLPASDQTRKFVVVARRDGDDLKHITGDAWDGEPAWAHDGERIYFSRAPYPKYSFRATEIYAVDLETRSLRRLTENDVPDRLPDPRPSRRSLPDPPEPRTGSIVVPALRGRHVQVEDERRRLRQLGLKLRAVPLAPENGALALVREQAPRAGSRVPEGTVVMLAVEDLSFLYSGKAFSVRAWNEHPDCAGAPNPRALMYTDLVRRVLRRGMPREHLLSLLGDPARAEGQALDWPLGRQSFVRVGCIYLRVEFDRRGRATRFYQQPG